MTHRERFVRTLRGQEVDRVPFIKVFGGDNAHRPEWHNEYPGIGKCIDEVLRFDGPYRGWQVSPVNMDVANKGEPVISQRSDGLMVHRWEDGTVRVYAPDQDFHSQTLEWPVNPYEVQAGNDVIKMLDTYPQLGIVGGLNKNVMAAGKDAIDREMERARALIRKGRFIPGPDHFVLSDVTFANYRYFMERLREVVMTTRPGT